MKPVSLLLTSTQVRSQLWTQSSPSLPKYKNTFLQSSLHDSCRISCAAVPLQRVDMKSLRTNTEVGRMNHNSSSMCIKEQQQQQQHADVSFVWSRSLVSTREQRREEKHSVHPCNSSSSMAIICHFQRDNETVKTTHKPAIYERCFR